MSVSRYIPSLRLRTLPLSVSGIILGSGLAYHSVWQVRLSESHFWIVFALAVCTTLCLQIVSNLSNELGDALKGTDADQHGRAAYGLQAGTVTVPEMKRLIALFVGLSVVFGTALVFTAFFGAPSLPFASSSARPVLPTLVFLGLGAMAIIGAMTYTLGKHSYGYIGLGDLGVFLFFGLLSTLGAFYLQAQTLSVEALCAAAAIGLPCVGVLNLNNIRDMNNDRAHGKHTFASILGEQGAKLYHGCLLVVCMVLFACIGRWWTLCILPVWAWHTVYIFIHKNEQLDIQMPVLMLSTLAVACLACIPS
jgi:1,4-dihydroxy-2-naphthoate octaprenyltransferase